MSDAVLTIWVVYQNPCDYPGKVVVRGQDVVRGLVEPRPHATCKVYDKLCRARLPLARMRLYRMARHPSDDPCIVETWM